MSGRPVTVPWTSFVAMGLVVKGFSLRQWMSANKKKVPKMMETIAKLVNADKLRVEYTEYELSAEVGTLWPQQQNKKTNKKKS